MNKKDKARKDSVFSWNDQSANIRTVTWESDKKLNIKMYEKKNWKKVKAIKTIMAVRRRAQPTSEGKSSRYVRKLRYSLDIDSQELDTFSQEDKEHRKIERQLILARFKKVVTKIILLQSVFMKVLKYAMEKGGHAKITSDPRLRLKVHHAHLRSDHENTFYPDHFKTDYQGYFPKWAKEIALKAPGDRSDDEIDSLNKILKQLKEFRRYTPEIQRLLCKVARYDRFGRHRVIIRKGHVGRRFYIIYSGTVAFTLSEDDCEVFSKPTEYYNLGKGDAFGELALIRNVKRSATIVCLQPTEFLYIEKEDFTDLGIVDILRREMEIRVEFLRKFDLFSTWPQHVLQNVAEESRSMEYRNDSVIDKNLLQSDMVYVVIKGRCQVFRLLDLTHSKKWMRLRRNQKKLCRTEFPETSSNTPFSRQGAFSRASSISNQTAGCKERRIARTFSQPHPPHNTGHIKPRLVKSAQVGALTQKRESVATSELKKAVSHCSSQESRSKSAFSRVESELHTKLGVGVFLILDIIEKGKSLGIEGVLRTEEDRLPDSNPDRRQLFLVSKGCFIISIPVETVRKHADYKTIKKIQKCVKSYPNDRALVESYLEKSRWNVYKEVLMGRIVKDIEKRRYGKKPGTMISGTLPVKQERFYAQSRNATRQTICGRPQSRFSQEESKSDKSQSSLSPHTSKCSAGLGSRCPYKPAITIYAQGSQRNLVLANGGIRVNATQEELEEQLFTHCMEDR